MTIEGVPEGSPYAFVRVPTGIGGLDEILLGGYPENGVYLIKGGPGPGRRRWACSSSSRAPDAARRACS